MCRTRYKRFYFITESTVRCSLVAVDENEQKIVDRTVLTVKRHEMATMQHRPDDDSVSNDPWLLLPVGDTVFTTSPARCQMLVFIVRPPFSAVSVMSLFCAVAVSNVS